jgi:stage IV sporulation protein A
MIMANIETEVSPAVGGEKSSEEIINFLLQEFEGDASKIWQSNIFGKSLYDIAGEGLTSKIKKMPEDTQSKLQETLQRIVNEGAGGLICIIL